jgi:hypothetical protein
MLEYFLIVVLAGNASGLVPVTRHATRAACEQQLAVEALHMTVTGRQVASAHCQRQRVPALRQVTGEFVR